MLSEKEIRMIAFSRLKSNKKFLFWWILYSLLFGIGAPCVVILGIVFILVSIRGGASLNYLAFVTFVIGLLCLMISMLIYIYKVRKMWLLKSIELDKELNG